MSKQSSVSRAHLSPHAYTARVEWCGIGHQELMSCTTLCHMNNKVLNSTIENSLENFVRSHSSRSWSLFFVHLPQILTYLCPSLPVEHRPSTTPRHHTLFWAALVIPDQLVPCCFSSAFSVSPPTVARPASLPLPLRVPGQGLACGAGCWLPEGVSDPAPLPPQYLLGHWFLTCSLPPQIKAS